ncbi:MAG: NADH-quinone oxidoreductase subunit NuoF [Candidatus Eisenbacteria bacterium]|uniref:NADH-quinone oxidoreductase subunit F n=1 Tax=Eiseniibacteriota bacterium TaxID=2212470 RepID=A0A849SLV5_UNCEI|nr:NADH-quinone oxidoreductase subunit NuoF [Candidatus Eisenbacteria bacterium]
MFANIDTPGLHRLETYRGQGGYAALAEVVGKKPADECIEIVKASGLRGRGGAGFPTGLKWSFVPKNSPKPKYIVCNADESEPGTFKDRELMEKNPHLLIEGMILTGYAIGSNVGYIYLRGEFEYIQRILDAAIAEARGAGLLGASVAGSGYAFELHTHLGAGAYICGEETALLSSLEGYRGQPRLKPPFPAVEGLYACPTVVNNTETLMNVPHILKHGGQWYRQWGTEKSAGTKIFSVSGPVKKPGNYEVPLGLSMKSLINDLCGGMRDGLELKAIIPGGSSVPLLPASDLDTPLDYEAMNAKGTFLGSGGVIVIDQGTCLVDALWNIIRFYEHESCGKCTPCREGTYWMAEVLERMEHGGARDTDIDLLADVADNILGKSFCALGDAAAMPVQGALKHFRAEFEYHVKHKQCMVNRRREELKSMKGVGVGA